MNTVDKIKTFCIVIDKSYSVFFHNHNIDSSLRIKTCISIPKKRRLEEQEFRAFNEMK